LTPAVEMDGPTRSGPVPTRIRVLLCDDNELYRAGIRAVLAQVSGVVVVAEAGNVGGALEGLSSVRPDVAVVDAHLTGGGALAVLPAAVHGGARVLVVVNEPDAGEATEVIRAGAAGYLCRTISAAQLAAAIRLISHGVTVLVGPIAREMGDRAGTAPELAEPATPPRIAGLTDRQLEVFQLVAGGLSNGEIARHLHVGEATVKSHVSALLRKLELRDRTQLVVFAHRQA
jgi:DNA-binding NarL/FixJ family response regulator